MHQVITIHVGPVETNCYLVCNPDRKQLLIIDPGAEADRIKEQIARTGMAPKAILLTHGHFDHIGAVKNLALEYGIPVIVGEDEKEFLTDLDKVVPNAFGDSIDKDLFRIEPDYYCKDGELLEYGGLYITCLATPGHTAGGISYFLPTEKVVFSGDTLFLECIGRTDFETGDAGVLVDSIRTRLYSLPPETLVFPGHGPATNIEYEKRYNLYTWEKSEREGTEKMSKTNTVLASLLRKKKQ